VLVGGAIAIALLGFGFARLLTASSGNDREAAPAMVPEQTKVAALGRLEPRGEVLNLSGPTGERLGRLLVKQGDWVHRGAALAYLEIHAERQAERDLAASELAEAEAKLGAETDLGQARVEEAQARLGQISQPKAYEIAAQQATIRQLEADFQMASDDLARFQSLFAEGAIAQQELDRQNSQSRQAWERLNNARSTLTRLEQTRDTDLVNAQAQLRAARANSQVSQLEVAVESARQNLALAEARLARTVIRAPRAGRILQITVREGEAIATDGAILDLGDTRQMYAVAEVYESNVGKVALGQPVTVTSRNGAFDRELTGTVAQMGWQIFKNDVLDDDPAANADARVMEVKIHLDDSEVVAAMTNLQVDVRIDVAGRSREAKPAANTTAER
jgi:HlyD family secretion protein